MPDPQEIVTEAIKGHVKAYHTRSKGYSEDFLLFWEQYPKRFIAASGRYVKIGKRLAWNEWREIEEEIHKFILSIISQMKVGTAVPDPWRWLRDGKYEDFEPPKPLPKPDPKAVAEQLEKEREYFRGNLGPCYREKTTEELEKILLRPTQRYKWLIKEIIAEREAKK